MDIAKLREEFSKLHTETTATIEAAVKAGRELTKEEAAANETRFARMDTIKKQVDDHKRLAALAFTADKVEKPAENPAKKEAEAEQFTEIKVIDNAERRVQFGQAFTRWARDGELDKRFATITTATQSAILLPVSVAAPMTVAGSNAFRDGFAAWGIDPMQTPGDTSTFNLPVCTAAAGGQVAETASSETENATTLTESIVSTCKTYQSGSAYYSNLVLNAPSFDLLAATYPVLAFNKELGLESTIAAAMIADAGITQTVATATTTGFTFANLVTLNNKLPKRFQQRKILLLSPDAIAAAEGLLDSQNRPILTPDAQNTNLRRILNVPVFRCDYLATLAASHVVGLMISLQGFHLRDAGQAVTRYTQVPAKPDQVGVNLFGYHAYGYAAAACATLKTPIS